MLGLPCELSSSSRVVWRWLLGCLLGIAATGLPVAAFATSLPEGWTSAASLLTPRFGHTATLIPSVNWVLVAGGSDAGGRAGNHPLASSEIYYAQPGRWGPVANMVEARYGHAAVVLRQGVGRQ